MRAHSAYQEQQVTSQSRIEIVLALYRKAIEHLQRGRQALSENRADDSFAHLAKAQMIVTSLASGSVGGTDEMSTNFLRLYEFVTDRIARAGVADLEAAEEVLQKLRAGFEEARGKAIALEASGALPAFGHLHTIQVTT